MVAYMVHGTLAPYTVAYQQGMKMKTIIINGNTEFSYKNEISYTNKHSKQNKALRVFERFILIIFFFSIKMCVF